MNLSNSAFLCLDIGTSGVRGIAHHIRGGEIDKSAIFSVDDTDTVFALKSVIDELEQKIGMHFDSAYITGNFGPSHFETCAKSTTWNGEHKITASDIRAQISEITPPEDFYPMHVIPLRYDTQTMRNMLTPIGHVDTQLVSAFGAIFYSKTHLERISQFLRSAHIQPIAFYAPSFVLNASLRKKKETVLFIDLGAEYTTASIWTDRGPIWHTGINTGGTAITNEISEKLNIPVLDAERIKRTVASMLSKEMDRFTPADTAYDFSRSDVNDIVMPHIINTVMHIRQNGAPEIEKYKPTKIVLAGGGAEIENISDFFENTFGLPCENAHCEGVVRALADYIWTQEDAHRNAYIERHIRNQAKLAKIKKLFHHNRKPKKVFVPIMPSTLSFNMMSPETYALFNAGGISAVHVDIMDGFYVDNIAGSINELKYIRAHTSAHLHVHLMTESPTVWANDAITAGADTIILSTGTSGLRNAIGAVRAAGKRVGIALNPDSPITLLKSVLRDLDEVMIMTVTPGAAGQQFRSDCIQKIKALVATRQKYKLRFVISVDGGINNDTAKMCWDAGADLLVCGSYLAHANDFPLALQSLMNNSAPAHQILA